MATFFQKVFFGKEIEKMEEMEKKIEKLTRPKPVPRTVYKCQICGEKYSNEMDALKCQNQEPEPVRTKRGTVIKKGDIVWCCDNHLEILQVTELKVVGHETLVTLESHDGKIYKDMRRPSVLMLGEETSVKLRDFLVRATNNTEW